MNNSIQAIPLVNLTLTFIPILWIIGILIHWSINAANTIYALFRMVLQLLLIGYFLAYLFVSDSPVLVLAVLTVMLFSSSWIALGTVAAQRRTLYKQALLAITVGGGVTLILVTQTVLNLDPWYLPRYMIPLAGMIFAAAMNSVSLAAERLNAEMNRGETYPQARNIALHASLIPVVNSLFAVGLVSLPGMMTGQILSGIEPFIAARYQIMVMCMMLSAAGISSIFFLALIQPLYQTNTR